MSIRNTEKGNKKGQIEKRDISIRFYKDMKIICEKGVLDLNNDNDKIIFNRFLRECSMVSIRNEDSLPVCRVRVTYMDNTSCNGIFSILDMCLGNRLYKVDLRRGKEGEQYSVLLDCYESPPSSLYWKRVGVLYLPRDGNKEWEIVRSEMKCEVVDRPEFIGLISEDIFKKTVLKTFKEKSSRKIYENYIHIDLSEVYIVYIISFDSLGKHLVEVLKWIRKNYPRVKIYIVGRESLVRKPDILKMF